MLCIGSRIRIPLEEFQFSFVRSSGPGGQNVNKVSSKAVLRWNLRSSPALPEDVRGRLLEKAGSRLTKDGDLIVSSDRYRDQGRNRDDCLEKVRELVAKAAVPPKKRRPTKPSRAAKRRRLESKQRHGQKKRQRRSVAED